jgi:hypothetical protein
MIHGPDWYPCPVPPKRLRRWRMRWPDWFVSVITELWLTLDVPVEPAPIPPKRPPRRLKDWEVLLIAAMAGAMLVTGIALALWVWGMIR